MSTPEPAVVTLRTGAEVPAPLVSVTALTLDRLMADNPIALYEAAMIARDPAHVPFGNTGEILRGCDFLDGAGQMHGATRDVILASTEVEAFGIRFVSPYASDSATEAAS